MNIFESERLMSIRRSGHADKLIRVYAPKGIEQCYGIYSHGRDYYLYAYVPARQVYTLTVMNLVITLVMYILILALVQVFRWNSARISLCSRSTPSKNTGSHSSRKTSRSSLPFSVKPRPSCQAGVPV